MSLSSALKTLAMVRQPSRMAARMSVALTSDSFTTAHPPPGWRSDHGDECSGARERSTESADTRLASRDNRRSAKFEVKLSVLR